MSVHTSFWRSPEQIARDRIRDAAPELLESVEALRAIGDWETCDQDDCKVCLARARVNAAIRAARGLEDR